MTAAAIRYVARKAERNRLSDERRLVQLGVDKQDTGAAIDCLRSSRITLNFHPDRSDPTGRTVAANLLCGGRYKSQFETGITNGGRSAIVGGDRTKWETALFGGAYDHGTAVPRPCYGALDLFNDPYGGSPRFGSSFVVLEPHCHDRATFCVGDSHLGPTDVGTTTQMMAVLAGAAEECLGAQGFGRDLSIDTLLQTIGQGPAVGYSARELDSYIEVQIHGAITLSEDVFAVYLDPSFAKTEVGQDLQVAAERFEFDLKWSEGSEVFPDEIDPEYRGSELVTLARQTTREDGLLDAASIGRALAGHDHNSSPSLAGDAEDSPLQMYKKLWHCCLKFGTPPQRVCQQQTTQRLIKEADDRNKNNQQPDGIRKQVDEGSRR